MSEATTSGDGWELAVQRLVVIAAVENELDARDARFTGDGTFADAVADRLGLAAPDPCPDGCGCRWRMDADRAECGCDGPCRGDDLDHPRADGQSWERRPDPDDEVAADLAAVPDTAIVGVDERGRELATFARWLIAMDDPNDADGMRARQTVTLTSIIAQARAALAVPGGTS